MFRKARPEDVAGIERVYNAVHTAEEAGKTTIGWIRGVYPTAATADAAVKCGDMYVYEENGEILASAIINQLQVDVYAGCCWQYSARDNEVMVIHTLCVSPAYFGKGIGTAFIKFYEDLAAKNGCTTLRLDTNHTNKAAQTLYKKLGYTEAGRASCVFNGIPGIELVLLEKRLPG